MSVQHEAGDQGQLSSCQSAARSIVVAPGVLSGCCGCQVVREGPLVVMEGRGWAGGVHGLTVLDVVFAGAIHSTAGQYQRL